MSHLKCELVGLHSCLNVQVKEVLNYLRIKEYFDAIMLCLSVSPAHNHYELAQEPSKDTNSGTLREVAVDLRRFI